VQNPGQWRDTGKSLIKRVHATLRVHARTTLSHTLRRVIARVNCRPIVVHSRGECLVEESRRHEQEESARGMTTSTAAIPTDSVAHTSQHQVRRCGLKYSAVLQSVLSTTAG
jgi:hypothetical protein